MGLLVLHQSILRELYAFLIVTEPYDEVDAVILRDGDPAMFDFVANLCERKKARVILIISNDDLRAVKIGAIPSLSDVVVPRLRELGVAPDSIHVIAGSGHSLRKDASIVDEWLNSKEFSSALLIGPGSRSRYARLVLDAALGDDAARRIVVYPMPHSKFDENHWWSERAGCRTLADGYFRLMFAWLTNGGDGLRTTSWDPDSYEQSLD